MSDKAYRISINGTLLDVTRELYLEYYRSKRRDRYYEHDIKIESAVWDKDGNIIEYRASREDSLNRLMDAGEDFRDNSESVEDITILRLMSAKLHEALRRLSDDERDFIETLYLSNGGDGMSERDYARISGIPHPTIHSRKVKLLTKLKKLMES